MLLPSSSFPKGKIAHCDFLFFFAVSGLISHPDAASGDAAYKANQVASRTPWLTA